ncbi:MAG TPA: extracellular solute-binding protein [Thermomicrobiales bacterium]|nr:extracellular solute-binding protein [Thermomicrobiales bacterium]
MAKSNFRRLADWPIDRRTLLKGAAATAGLATPFARYAAGGAVTLRQTPTTTDISGTSLSILLWSHFVPRFDVWFDKFVQEWGQANNVTTKVDHINTADVPAAIASEISAGQGHDIVEHIASLAQFEKSMLDLKDINDEATKRHGEQLGMAHRNSFNPTTGKQYGFCHGYAPDPGDYRRSLWDKAGLADGPKTWDDLLKAGAQIKAQQGVQMGIGMSNEIDSRMAAQTLMWAYGSAIQDENENVTINSPETIAAVEYMADLFKQTMTPEVFGWNAASNNQLLVAGRASYILNSISAYRTAQKDQPDVGKDIFFTRPLVGPAGEENAWAHGHAVFISMIPTYSKNQDTAKEFLLHLVDNYADACNQSELYNFPAWPSTVPDLFTADGWLANDPYKSDPADKLEALAKANDWTTNLGHPGPANAAMGEIFALPTLPNMMARVAQGQQSAKDSVAQAEQEIDAIFKKWRAEGLMGGG